MMMMMKILVSSFFSLFDLVIGHSEIYSMELYSEFIAFVIQIHDLLERCNLVENYFWSVSSCQRE